MTTYSNNPINFNELMDEIVWSWGDGHELTRVVESDGEVTFYLNKLYIDKQRASYKTDNWTLAPGVFEKLETFYKLLQE